jgi:hypothetical protein
MPIANNVDNYLVGASQVDRIYRGGDIVWENYAYPLDIYPNAQLGYSVRKLRSAYIGACMRVRRSSDNTEQDIGFVSNLLDTASLLSFVGAGDGFVTTWYNQAQNTYNMVQTVALNQPLIVSAGSLITEGGKPAILYDGTNDGLQCSPAYALASQQALSLFSVLQTSDTGGIQYWGVDIGRWFFILQSGSASTSIRDKFDIGIVSKNTIPQTLTTRNAWFLAFGDGTRHISYLRGSITIANPWNNFALMGYTGFSLGGRSQEVIIYPSNKDADRLGIEANINEYFGVY